MTRCPVAMRSVAFGTPTTAGIPYSRATTAPCDIIPPISITSALAVRKSGVHPGSVAGATSTSPGSRRAPAGESITRATPRAVPGEARATAREHADRVELRRLASAGERADAAKERAREHAARTVDPRQQRRDHRLRLPRTARELRVGREGGGVETLVVRDRAEQMRRILRPPGQTKVDLGDRAVPVALEERFELALQEGRQVAAAEGRAEVGRLAVRERRPRRRVFAGTRREGPEI